MSREIARRLSKLEFAATKKEGVSVWFPGEPKPEGWDAAEVQVDFPSCGCCPEEES